MRAAVLIAVLGALASGCIEKEGDFAIKMPELRTVAPPVVDRELISLEIRLKADNDGNLSDVIFDGRRLVTNEGDHEVFDLLTRRVREIVEEASRDEDIRPEYEAVIYTDSNLNHAFVINTIAAISGDTDAEGEVHKLVDRIRFATSLPTADDPADTSSDERE